MNGFFIVGYSLVALALVLFGTMIWFFTQHDRDSASFCFMLAMGSLFVAAFCGGD